MKHAASVELSNAEVAPASKRWMVRLRGLMNHARARRALPGRAAAQAPADFAAETKDAELTITAVRTVVLIVALVVPMLVDDAGGYQREEIWLAAVAGIYNMVAGLSCLLPSRYGLRRPF